MCRYLLTLPTRCSTHERPIWGEGEGGEEGTGEVRPSGTCQHKLLDCPIFSPIFSCYCLKRIFWALDPMLALFTILLALASIARAATPTVPDCKSNAECLARGLPLKAPRRLHRSSTINARQNPLPTSFTSTGSPQYYAVPKTGLYTIDIAGAAGGTTTYNGRGGGVGARFQAPVNLRAGENYTIISGGQGRSAYGAGGGGGGSFIYEKTSLAYLAVAGGGGGGQPSDGGASGPNDLTGTATSGGSGGAGGKVPPGPYQSFGPGAGGAGVNAPGDSYTAGQVYYASAQGGLSRDGSPPWAGGASVTSWGGSGGYGGGGSAGNSAGGGGGYSGGDGGLYFGGKPAGAGGNYVDSNKLNGQVTFLPAPSSTGQVTFTFVG